MVRYAEDMELTYRQEGQRQMNASYMSRGVLMRQFKGLFVPERIHKWYEWECGNVYCNDIPCQECILFPTISTKETRDTYEREQTKNFKGELPDSRR